MKVLVVASGNGSKLAPFITDQVESLANEGIEMEYFLIKGKGISGYMKNYRLLLQKIEDFHPAVIHAHYGLSGLFSALQRKVPVLTTFHGSDINMPLARKFSKLAMILSKKSIFVSQQLAHLAKVKKAIVIPCGVDMDVFYPMDRLMSRKKMGLCPDKKYLLFSSNFSNQVKNYPLAKEAISLFRIEGVELIELKGFDRNQVALMMNAADAVLLTSKSEGSPQFIKEAMACNTPIIATDVGDIREVVQNTEGCFIANDHPEDLAVQIERALDFGRKTTGRKLVAHLDNKIIAKKLKSLYQEIEK